MDQPAVSIIVPVYNVEEYLPRCLDSILSQTLRNIEIIAIDDGSSDGSSSILDLYASRDARLIAVHIENGGVSAARNKGLSLARGKYIGFVDSDDYVESTMFETLVYYAERTGADVTQCEFKIIYGPNRVEITGKTDRLMVYDRNDAICALMNLDINFNVWSKIFRRKLVTGLYFYEQWSFAEDCRFIIDCLFRSNTVCTIPNIFYNYYARINSLAHKDIDEDKVIGLEIYDYLKAKLGENILLEKIIAERELLENLKCLNASIGHSNIRKELIIKMVGRIHNDRDAILRNRYMSNMEKVMAKMVVRCPSLYLSIVKGYKKIKGVK